MEFEWDPDKADANLRKHGISFEFAKDAFLDDNSIEWADEYGHEERTVLLALVETTMLYIIYTERTPVIRLISARKADKHEQSTYYYENFSGRTPH